jgi:hypothetical protein
MRLDSAVRVDDDARTDCRELETSVPSQQQWW